MACLDQPVNPISSVAPTLPSFCYYTPDLVRWSTLHQPLRRAVRGDNALLFQQPSDRPVSIALPV